MAETNRRNFRVEDALWQKALAKAKRDGDTLSDLIRQWLADYAEYELPGAESPQF